MPDMTSIAASGRLQNAMKYCTNSRIIQPLFNLAERNFTRTSMPAWSTVIANMTAPAASGPHFSQFAKKTAENATSNSFGWNYSGAAFCQAKQIGGFLVLFSAVAAVT